MKKILPILLTILSLCLAENIYDESWAIIIGINEYNNIEPLAYAVNDAEAIKDLLIHSFDFPKENISFLVNKDATKINILKEFSKIIRTKANERDRILIFFAGHGETEQLPEGGEMGYLIPVDGNLEDLFVSAINMDELKNLGQMSKAKHILYLVDACYGGIAATTKRGLINPSKQANYMYKIRNDKSRYVITAGGKDEQVIEKSEWGHSAFTRNLMRGLDRNADLNTDGFITSSELGMYLQEKVPVDSDNQQTPIYRQMGSYDGEFIFDLKLDKEIEQKNVNNIERFDIKEIENSPNYIDNIHIPSYMDAITKLDVAKHDFFKKIKNIEYKDSTFDDDKNLKLIGQDYDDLNPQNGMYDAPNGTWDEGENFEDTNNNGIWDEEEYFQDGELWQGHWRSFFHSGEIEFEAIYYDDDAEGYAVWYYPNGKIAEEAILVGNNRHGPWRFFYENRELNQTGNFINNNRHGELVSFYPNSMLEFITNYKDGVHHGNEFRFHPNGKLKIEAKLYNGLKVENVIEYYESGNVKEKGNYINDKLNGEYIRYYDSPNRTIKQVFNIEKGIPNGPSTWYYENGEIEIKGNFINDKLNGEYLIYFKNGSLNQKLHYIDGNLNGEFEIFYESGFLKEKGILKMGNRNGEIIKFHENGEVKAKGKYENGEKDGLWKNYDESGKLINKEKY